MAPRAVVVGSGPNGLSAAVRLAQGGYAVQVLEAADTLGGGARSAEVTLPGFTHHLCSPGYPFAAASPCFRSLPLAAHGLESVQRRFRARTRSTMAPPSPWSARSVSL